MEKKKDQVEIPVNSKGNRKSYKSGVVGWQKYLQTMRFYVNLNQHASGCGMEKTLIDMSIKGIEDQEKVLSKEKIKIPARLEKRRIIAKKRNMPTYQTATSDFYKELRKIVELIEKADKLTKSAILGQINKVYDSIVKSGEKIPGRLAKKILDLD